MSHTSSKVQEERGNARVLYSGVGLVFSLCLRGFVSLSIQFMQLSGIQFNFSQ